MTPSELPENLTDLDAEALTNAQAELREAAAWLREQALSDDAAAEELEQIVEAFQRVGAELTARAEADAARAERVNAASGLIGIDGEGETGEEPAAEETEDTVAEPAAAAVETETEPEVEAEPAAAAVETPEPEAPAPAAAETAAVAETPSDTPATNETGVAEPAAAAVEAETNEDPAAPAVAQPAQEAAMTQPTTDPVAGMTVNRPADVAPATDGRGDSRPLALFRATAANERADHDRVLDGEPGDPQAARRALAVLFDKKITSLQKRGATVVGREPIVLATATSDIERKLSGDIYSNFAVIEGIRGEAEALVASGGNCAPLAPRYDVFSVAEPQSPVEAFLPVLGAPRGGVRYVQGPDWTDARAGVRITTTAEDAAGYTPNGGPTAVKPCVDLECPPIVECEVDAVSRCVTFGNLQYRTFPELIEVFLDHLAVAFAEEKEIAYLDAIDAGSTAVTGGIAYGATRSAYYTLSLALHAYRKRNHMSLDAPLQVLAPDTFVPLLKADMVNDNTMGLGFLDANAEQVANAMFSGLRANVGWYYDGASDYSLADQMQVAQAEGALNDWPCEFRFYIFAPGTWGRLDGGTLDVGIVRDSELNSTNDLQMFAEQWIQACKFGNESIRLDMNLTANGAAPEWVAPIEFCVGS